MENIDKIYNYLINRLRDTKPELGEPKALTDNIMNELQKTSVTNTKRIIQWARPVMTTAALFLLALFIFQQLDEPDELPVSSFAYRENLNPKTINNNCFTEVERNGNKNKSLFSLYLCYMKQTKLANDNSKLILVEQFSKYQTKPTI